MQRLISRGKWICLLAAAICLLFSRRVGAASLNKKKLSLYTGDKAVLKVRGASGKVQWSSSANRVAYVFKNGVVRAKRPGKAVITAAFGNKTLTCRVVVRDVPLKHIRNIYIDTDNTKELPGKVILRPVRIRYSSGRLIADCNLINGTDRTIRAVRADYFGIGSRKLMPGSKNANGLIAEGHFDLTHLGRIKGHGIKGCTIIFKKSDVRVKKADLTGRLFFASTLRYKVKRKKESA